jgi:hypothetical protein
MPKALDVIQKLFRISKEVFDKIEDIKQILLNSLRR